jgi:1,6-anhydro-N-acetylmuramate kinase
MNHEIYRQKEQKLIIGLMCGTSVDRVDAALCRLRGYGRKTEIELIQYLEYPVPEALRAEIFNAFQPNSSNVRQISQLNFAIGELFAEAANAVRDAAGLASNAVDAIGSHGRRCITFRMQRNLRAMAAVHLATGFPGGDCRALSNYCGI